MEIFLWHIIGLAGRWRTCLRVRDGRNSCGFPPLHSQVYLLLFPSSSTKCSNNIYHTLFFSNWLVIGQWCQSVNHFNGPQRVNRNDFYFCWLLPWCLAQPAGWWDHPKADIYLSSPSICVFQRNMSINQTMDRHPWGYICQLANMSMSIYYNG